MLFLICRVLVIAAVIGSYLLSNRYLKGSKQKNIRNIVWCGIVILYGLLVKASAFTSINLRDTSFIVFSVASIALEAINLLYFRYIKSSDRKVNLYRVFVRPITVEFAIGGVVLPQLCSIRFLLYGFNLSFVFFNGALVIALLLSTWLLWDEEKNRIHWRLAGNQWLNLGICYFHLLIIYVTGSVLIPLILRIVYGILILNLDVKPLYGAPVDNEEI